jgi:hypothetical protein
MQVCLSVGISDFEERTARIFISRPVTLRNAAAKTGLFATLRVAKKVLHEHSTLGQRMEVFILRFSLAICGPFSSPKMYQSATK